MHACMQSGLENSTRPLVFTSTKGSRASENFEFSSENQILPIYANNFCDAGQVSIFRYFKACAASMHTSIHPSIHLHIEAYMYIHACTYIHEYLHASKHAYIRPSMHAYTQACMHAYIHIHTYFYIHTYVH